MRIAELLTAMAAWLESPNNEAILLAEDNEHCLNVVAESCVLAAALLKKAAEEVDLVEPAAPSHITSQSVEEMAALATVLDASDDPQLKKMASVLDELLLTIAANPRAMAEKQATDNARIDELRRKYEQPRQDLRAHNHIDEMEKGIDKSQMTKQYNILEAPLQTRTCPDHPGAQMGRVEEGVFLCDLDKKRYDFRTGYTLYNGDKVPGGSVSEQTQNLNRPQTSIFDDRAGRLGYHQ